jgi:hypothetical protein
LRPAATLPDDTSTTSVPAARHSAIKRAIDNRYRVEQPAASGAISALPTFNTIRFQPHTAILGTAAPTVILNQILHKA